jgi:hypothetical protein
MATQTRARHLAIRSALPDLEVAERLPLESGDRLTRPEFERRYESCRG